MRTYPRNSPQAAARIVALAMLADGHLCRSELTALERLGATRLLGIDAVGLHGVVHDLCEDLLATAVLSWNGTCRVDPSTLAQLLAEVQDPTLRRSVLRLCRAVVEADTQMTEGESCVLAALVAQWGLQHELLLPAAA